MRRQKSDENWKDIKQSYIRLGTMKNFSEKDTSWKDKNLGFPIDNVRILANKKFVEANPVAKRFFEQIEIPIEDVNIQQEKVKNGENKNVDICHHAEEWIANHQELFDGWLEVAKS